MKTLKIFSLFCLMIMISNNGLAQRHHPGGRPNHPHHPHPGKRSPYRPKKVVVYHPVWHPAYACNRRWVYFPKYNIYWDNWRNHYRFWNGTIWISQPAPPPVIVNVDLSKEKHYELKENDDDNDDVNSDNETHKQEYKPE